MINCQLYHAVSAILVLGFSFPFSLNRGGICSGEPFPQVASTHTILTYSAQTTQGIDKTYGSFYFVILASNLITSTPEDPKPGYGPVISAIPS